MEHIWMTAGSARSGRRVVLATVGVGSRRWRLAAARLARQASSTGWFTSVHLYDEARLHERVPEFFMENETLSPGTHRGYGYWLWRPYVLQNELAGLASGDVAVFLDAGCELNPTPETLERFRYYLESARTNDGCLMRTEFPLRDWCKQDVIQGLGVDDVADDLCTLEPGVMFVSPTSWARDLMREWISWGRRDNYRFIDDSPSRLPNAPSFVEHRHDQAILSCLLADRQELGIAQETSFPGQWRGRGSAFPVWATRNRTPVRMESAGLSAVSARSLRSIRDLVLRRGGAA
jgi:hypothetical protein